MEKERGNRTGKHAHYGYLLTQRTYACSCSCSSSCTCLVTCTVVPALLSPSTPVSRATKFTTHIKFICVVVTLAILFWHGLAWPLRRHRPVHHPSHCLLACFSVYLLSTHAHTSTIAFLLSPLSPPSYPLSFSFPLSHRIASLLSPLPPFGLYQFLFPLRLPRPHAETLRPLDDAQPGNRRP
ncbi:hypothetical protein LZ30DRAFT_292481 [Colletotrichum cereale]|nr:hypothetical protein LZ30DRAFT_292481 [Colletotrichum cereale]